MGAVKFLEILKVIKTKPNAKGLLGHAIMCQMMKWLQ